MTCPFFEGFSCSSFVWAGTRSNSLDMLDKLDKRRCRVVGLTRNGTLEPLAYSQNVDTLEIRLPKICIPISKTSSINP